MRYREIVLGLLVSVALGVLLIAVVLRWLPAPDRSVETRLQEMDTRESQLKRRFDSVLKEEEMRPGGMFGPAGGPGARNQVDQELAAREASRRGPGGLGPPEELRRIQDELARVHAERQELLREQARQWNTWPARLRRAVGW
jgi:hypothetical protein